jgi:hypothetical protein
MKIELDHTIVPARNQQASAEKLAAILDVPWSVHGVGPFCPVYVNEGLTLDIDQADGDFAILSFHACSRWASGTEACLMGRPTCRSIPNTVAVSSIGANLTGMSGKLSLSATHVERMSRPPVAANPSIRVRRQSEYCAGRESLLS